MQKQATTPTAPATTGKVRIKETIYKGKWNWEILLERGTILDAEIRKKDVRVKVGKRTLTLVMELVELLPESTPDQQ